MDTPSLLPQVDALADNIDDLEDALGPLLQSALSTHASKLPLLDKAKLYTLVTYAIESMLFSYLSLNGVKAKEHAVFTELTRVRQYFQKIKQVEDAPIKPNQSLDKAAANRFIKAGLAGNDQYDKERALRQAKERAIAQLKLEQLSSKKRKADDAAEDNEASSESSSSESDEDEEEEQEPEEPQPRKSKRAKATDMWEAGASEDKGGKKQKGKKNGKQKKAEEDPGEPEGDAGEDNETGRTRKQKSGHVPLGHKGAFQALLKGPLPKRDESQAPKKKGKGKRKSRG
ncbi:exosome-associated family protein [Diplodia corticola]|uniref:Exosome complex protein n=1 Tax=Diplodia corticola TaxID=236234 RepID=A0A1J9RAB2_9PEZI|nr:exosome-associated family protein [Diplodia corticola]OJD37409.1 exosome-associated family protein [Diplodia corticola]